MIIQHHPHPILNHPLSPRRIHPPMTPRHQCPPIPFQTALSHLLQPRPRRRFRTANRHFSHFILLPRRRVLILPLTAQPAAERQEIPPLPAHSSSELHPPLQHHRRIRVMPDRSIIHHIHRSLTSPAEVIVRTRGLEDVAPVRAEDEMARIPSRKRLGSIKLYSADLGIPRLAWSVQTPPGEREGDFATPISKAWEPIVVTA
jgi:hypothetical protein